MIELEKLLNQLESEMVTLSCWQSYPIDPDALMSTEPFCIDTLSLPQWLQFVLIARLRALIDGDLSLPSGSGVLPLAEEYFKSRKDALPLLRIIDALDAELGRAAL